MIHNGPAVSLDAVRERARPGWHRGAPGGARPPPTTGDYPADGKAIVREPERLARQESGSHDGSPPLMSDAPEWERDARFVHAELERHGDELKLLGRAVDDLRRLVARATGALWVVGLVAGVLMPGASLYLSWQRTAAAPGPVPVVTHSREGRVAILERTMRGMPAAPP